LTKVLSAQVFDTEVNPNVLFVELFAEVNARRGLNELASHE
jgi:hypothetical protein